MTIVYGSKTGLNTQRSVNLTNPTGDQAHSSFGYTLVAADLTGDGYPDLAVGAPQADRRAQETEDFPPSVSVTILRGSARGIQTTASITLRGREIPHQDYDFGSSLADLDDDGYDDFVIGSPGEDINAGYVSVVYGAEAGWRLTGNRTLGQATPGVPRNKGTGCYFGGALSLLDYNADGRPDLTVGAYQDAADSGSVTVLRGSGGYFTTTGAQATTLAGLKYSKPASASYGATLGG